MLWRGSLTFFWHKLWHTCYYLYLQYWKVGALPVAAINQSGNLWGSDSNFNWDFCWWIFKRQWVNLQSKVSTECLTQPQSDEKIHLSCTSLLQHCRYTIYFSYSELFIGTAESFLCFCVLFGFYYSLLNSLCFPVNTFWPFCL